MKKICFFGGNLNNAGGTERVSIDIANALSEDKERYKVYMLNLWEGLSPFFKLNENIDNHQIHSQQISFSKGYLLTIYRLRKYLIENKIDVLIVVESMLALFSLPAVVGLKLKHITWEHFNYNVDLGRMGRRLARHLSRIFSDKIVTLTERDKKIWLNKTIGSAEIVAIPNPSPYPINHNIPSFMNKRVLSIGRLTYQKGFDLLLQAWSIVMRNTHFQDWKLQIVGEGEDKTELENLIKKLNLGSSVKLYPFSNQIDIFYKNASIFCLSSRFEGLGMVLVEAQCFGLPAVSFNCDIGPAEIIEDGKNGYLCTPENIEDLADKLISIMSLDPEKYLNMSKLSKVSALKFSADCILDKWKEIL